MYFCTSSEPTSLMNVALVSFATAWASSVLPVPGAPISNTPVGGSIPTLRNSSGFNNGSSTTSLISLIWSSRPPMCAYLILGFSIISASLIMGSFDACKIPITDNESRFSDTLVLIASFDLSTKLATCTTKFGPVVLFTTTRLSSKISTTSPIINGGDFSFFSSWYSCWTSFWSLMSSFSMERLSLSARIATSFHGL